MCTGRLDLSFVLRAFSRGVDAVFIAGCHLNECNYITHGNYRALSMVHLGKALLERLGLNPERLRMELISGGEGTRFAELMNEYGREVKLLGPLGQGEGMEGSKLKSKLEAATQLIPYLRLLERERLRIRFKSEEEYVRFFGSDEFRRLFEETVGDHLALSQIVLLLRQGPMSTAEISRRVGLTPSAVSRHMNTASRHRLVRYDTTQKSYALA
jgi:F420-non-reducing hydrogenase iron-sulfur subunit